MYRIISAFFLLLSCMACDPCKNLDCATDNFSGQFRIVSAVDGRDLLFGTTAVYDKSRIRFYGLSGTDTTFFETTFIRFPGTGYDSIVATRLFPKTETVYLRLSNNDTDTFQLSFTSRDTRCCGSITEISRFRFNNTIDLPGSTGTVEIRK